MNTIERRSIEFGDGDGSVELVELYRDEGGSIFVKRVQWFKDGMHGEVPLDAVAVAFYSEMWDDATPDA